MTVTGPLLLSDLGIWPDAARMRLAECWVTTAEQLAGIAATAGGVDSLVAQTGLPADQLTGLLAATLARLGPVARDASIRPAQPHAFGLGAVPPRKDGG